MPLSQITQGIVAISAVVPPAYTGPGDVVSGAVGWWGLRAYSNATIGTNAVRLREDGGNTEQDFATISGGGLDASAISSFKGANNLFVVKLYDQSGNGRDISQATAGQQPGLQLSGLGSLPVLTFAGVQSLETAGTLTASQPFTCSGVADRTGTGTYADIIGSGASSPQFGYPPAASTVLLYAGSLGQFSPITDSTWHAIQGIFNGAASVAYFDGSANTVDAGTGGFGSTVIMGNGNGPFTGMIGEAGVWSFGFSSGNRTSMDSNQHTYWGF